MAEEKRVKLGVDIGALSQELLQVNRLVEENYQKSIKGQQDYNAILEESIGLLEKQAQLVSQLGGDLQNSIVGGNHGGGGGNNSPIHVIVDNIPLQVEMVKGAAGGGGGASMGVGAGSGEMSISDIKKMLILIDKARGADSSADNSEEAHDNETELKENDILRAIQEDLDQIWEKFSEGVTTPIPVLITNSPLDTNDVNGGGNGGSGDGSDDGSSGGGSGSGGKKGKGGQNNLANQAANIITQTDPNYVLAGLMAAIPYVGAGLSAIASKLISEAEQRDIASHRFRGAAGRFDLPSKGTPYGSFTSIGLKDAEAYEKLAAYYAANINLKQSDLKFEKGFNISSGTIDALLRSFREDIANGLGASVVGVDFLQGLSKKGGIEWNEVRGYSEDYLKILVELNQKQLETVGQTNALISGNVVQSIAQLDTHFGDPTILTSVVQGIESGLTQAKNPQIEALQYYALAQANPGASIWEMQMMKENPFGRESVGYFSNFLESLLSTGNLEDAKFNIMNTFDLSAHQTEYLVNGIMRAKHKNAPEYQDENGNFSLRKYLEHKDFGELTMTSSRTTRRYKTPASNVDTNGRYIYKVLPELLREAGLDIRVTSGYRTPEEQRKFGTSPEKSWHTRHGAVDIVPQGNTTWEDIEEAIYNNPEIYNYLLQNGYGIIDETGRTAASRATMQRTKVSGAHFHFGKDSKYAAAYRNKMAAKGITASNQGGTIPAGNDVIEYTDYQETVTGGLSDAASLIESEAAAATSDVQRHVAEAQNRLAEWGEPLLDLTSQVVDGIGVIADGLPGFIDTATGFFTDFWGTLGEMVTDLEKGIVDGIVDGIGKLLPGNWGSNNSSPHPNNMNPQYQP